jgi:hypothetical protein
MHWGLRRSIALLASGTLALAVAAAPADAATDWTQPRPSPTTTLNGRASRDR